MAVDTNWILGVAIMFSLAMVMTYITYKDVESFFIWLTIFSGFVVWGGLLDLWVLIANVFIVSLIIINRIYRRREVT